MEAIIIVGTTNDIKRSVRPTQLYAIGIFDRSVIAIGRPKN
jgi:hypothetical protein